MGERNPISAQLRTRLQAITDAWELRVRAELPVLDRLDNHALCDHLPEVLEAIATWVEGEFEQARPGLGALAVGHAIQRLGYGVDLETLTHEYALLRRTLIADCLGAAITTATPRSIARLDEALDIAILGAVRHYTSSRDEARDRFIGILAHDLRNPLQTIAVATEALGTVRDDVVTRGARAIARSAERMDRMIEDIIDLAREHLADGIPLVLRPGDLGELCREALDELATGHPERRLQLDVSGDLEGHWDHDRVVQAMSNVIGNAIQHGLDPISVAAHESADRQAVISTVRNAGPAPSRAVLAAMFDPFRSTGGGQRLGLGLYIVRAIARAHGAVCDVELGADGEGFTFRIVWPRVPNERMPLRGSSP